VRYSLRRPFTASAFAISAALMIPTAPAQTTISSQTLSLIPFPRHITAYEACWALPSQVNIKASTPAQRHVAEFLIRFLRQRGIHAAIDNSPRPEIAFKLPASGSHLGNEGYRLIVSGKGAQFIAHTGTGYFYALQTFEQLFNAGKPADNAVHEVVIRDQPRYRWRGMMLDCSRHFFSPAVVKQFIRLAAHYKINVFHWHLTDDQGWRVQIPQYPQLTQIGAWRDGTEMDGNPHDISHHRYGGFYTDAQIRRIVAYARRRYVTVVPEIDIPGHCTAALAAYPWLAAARGPFHVRIRWGISNVPLNPGARTFHFLDTVFGELTKLFPGRYIHLGGDEVSAKAMQVWMHDPTAAKIMSDRHWTAARLHDYFPTRMARFLAARGRRAVVWNDVPAKNLPHSTIIECWNSSNVVAKDARLGHDVIVANLGNLYFNFCQGDPRYSPHAIKPVITIHRVYHFNPSALLPPSLQPRLLGVEACLWSERIATARHLFYQALPRELAFAEIAWTPLKKQNYRAFIRRTSQQYLWLQSNHYNFCVPPPSMRLLDARTKPERVPAHNLMVYRTKLSQGLIQIIEPVPGTTIYYTLNGSMPTDHSQRYQKPIAVSFPSSHGMQVRCIAITQSGKASAPAKIMIDYSPG